MSSLMGVGGRIPLVPNAGNGLLVFGFWYRFAIMEADCMFRNTCIRIHASRYMHPNTCLQVHASRNWHQNTCNPIHVFQVNNSLGDKMRIILSFVFGVVHRVWIRLWILGVHVFVRRTARRRYNGVMGGVGYGGGDPPVDIVSGGIVPCLGDVDFGVGVCAHTRVRASCTRM